MSELSAKRAKPIEEGECRRYFSIENDFIPLPPKESVDEYIKRKNKENEHSQTATVASLIGYNYGEEHNNHIISLTNEIKNYKKSIPQSNAERITINDLKITYKDTEYNTFVNCFEVKYKLLFAENSQYKKLFINNNEVLYKRYKIELHKKLTSELNEKKRKFVESLPENTRTLYSEIEHLNNAINNF